MVGAWKRETLHATLYLTFHAVFPSLGFCRACTGMPVTRTEGGWGGAEGEEWSGVNKEALSPLFRGSRLCRANGEQGGGWREWQLKMDGWPLKPNVEEDKHWVFKHIVSLKRAVEALCLSFIVQYLPNPLSVQLWPKKREGERVE